MAIRRIRSASRLRAPNALRSLSADAGRRGRRVVPVGNELFEGRLNPPVCPNVLARYGFRSAALRRSASQMRRIAMRD